MIGINRHKQMRLFCGLILCLFLCIAFSVFAADMVTYESLLVWNVDGTGDYALPEIQPKTFFVSSGVETKGIVNYISASWKAEGDVTLELSADDGLHFTPVTNGVPLEKNFIQGNSIKWRASLGAESKLMEVKITYHDETGVLGSFGSPELSGFKYRKSLLIKGSDKALFNYQVKIIVGESALAKDADISCDARLESADFSDIRFVLPDGETVLPHYLEKVTGTKPNRMLEFFVKVPEIPKDGIKLYLYYGNNSAKNLSSPKKTFDFYDDFSDKKIFEENWQERLNPGGSVSLADGGLDVSSAAAITRDYQFSGGIIEYSATAVSGFEARLIVRTPTKESGVDNRQIVYSSAYSGAQHCIAVGNIVKANVEKPIEKEERYDYRVTVDKDNNISFERFQEGFAEKEAEVSYKDDNGLQKGFLGLETAASTSGSSMTEYHWIRARQYTSPAPAVDKESIGKEETVSLPVFINTVIAPNGDIVLAEGVNEGSYLTKKDAADYEVIILAPTWKGSGLSVDISADAGKTYKKNASNESCYYAAKGDFEKGNSIRSRVIFKNTKSVSAKLEQLNIQYAAGSLVLLSPVGGENYNLGSKMPIKWTAWDYDKEYLFKIEYSINEGKTYAVIAKQAQNNGSYIWNIPADTALLTKKALIKITDSFNQDIFDVSPKPFSILPALLDTEQATVTEEEKIIESESSTASTAAAAAASEAAIEAEKQAEAAVVPDLEKIIEIGERTGTKLYDIVIKLNDNRSSDPIEDARASFKEGDIVLVLPAGNNWSDTERKSYLIIQAYLTSQEAAVLMNPSNVSSGQRKIQKIDLKKFGLLPKLQDKEQRLKAIRKYLEDKALDPKKIVEEVDRNIPTKGQAAWMQFQERLNKMAKDIYTAVLGKGEKQ